MEVVIMQKSTQIVHFYSGTHRKEEENEKKKRTKVYTKTLERLRNIRIQINQEQTDEIKFSEATENTRCNRIGGRERKKSENQKPRAKKKMISETESRP